MNYKLHSLRKAAAYFWWGVSGGRRGLTQEIRGCFSQATNCKDGEFMRFEKRFYLLSLRPENKTTIG
jgi:hypothetical protein